MIENPDVVFDDTDLPPLKSANPPKSTNPEKPKRNKTKQSRIRKELLKNEQFKMNDDPNNTNIFNPETQYIDQSGNIRSRESKAILYRYYQITRLSTGDNPIVAAVEFNNPVAYQSGQTRNSQVTNPSGFQRSIAQHCGLNGEMIAEQLCEIAFANKKKRGKKKKVDPTAPVYTPKDSLEALKLLVYYFAGKPVETQTIDKNVNTSIEKKVASFMKIVGGKK